MKLTINEIEDKIRPILRKVGISSISVTGLVARGEQPEKSDVDLIVELNSAIGLLTFSRIKKRIGIGFGLRS
jgi:predicted nucleotidyltransferase